MPGPSSCLKAVYRRRIDRFRFHGKMVKRFKARRKRPLRPFQEAHRKHVGATSFVEQYREGLRCREIFILIK